MSIVNHSQPSTNDSLQLSILRILKDGPYSCSEVTGRLNKDERWKDLTVFQIRPWLLTLCETGDAIEELDGRYGLPHGGYSPGGNAA